MFHEVATLVHPIESSKRAARAQGIRSVVLLEVPRLPEGRPYLARVATRMTNLGRDKVVHKKIAGEFGLISPFFVGESARRLDEEKSRHAPRFLQPAMAWE